MFHFFPPNPHMYQQQQPPALFQVHGLFLFNIYILKYINTTCTVCTMFLDVVFSGLTIWYSVGVLFAEELFLLPSVFLSCIQCLVYS